MPRGSPACVSGRILRLQHQRGAVRSRNLHGMETQSAGQVDEAQICDVPPGERESLHHGERVPGKKGSAPVGKKS